MLLENLLLFLFPRWMAETPTSIFYFLFPFQLLYCFWDKVSRENTVFI